MLLLLFIYFFFWLELGRFFSLSFGIVKPLPIFFPRWPPLLRFCGARNGYCIIRCPVRWWMATDEPLIEAGGQVNNRPETWLNLQQLVKSTSTWGRPNYEVQLAPKWPVTPVEEELKTWKQRAHGHNVSDADNQSLSSRQEKKGWKVTENGGGSVLYFFFEHFFFFACCFKMADKKGCADALAGFFLRDSCRAAAR